MKKIVITILIIICLGFGGYYFINQNNNIANNPENSATNLISGFKETVIELANKVNDLKFVDSINYTIDEAKNKIEDLTKVNEQLETLKSNIVDSSLVSSVKDSFEDGINQVISFIQEQINNFQKIINNN